MNDLQIIGILAHGVLGLLVFIGLVIARNKRSKMKKVVSWVFLTLFVGGVIYHKVFL